MNKFVELRKRKTCVLKSEYVWNEWFTYKMGGAIRLEIYLRRRDSFRRTEVEAEIMSHGVT